MRPAHRVDSGWLHYLWDLSGHMALSSSYILPTMQTVIDIRQAYGAFQRGLGEQLTAVKPSKACSPGSAEPVRMGTFLPGARLSEPTRLGF